MARNNLFFLLNKFIFAHLLKSFNQRAFLVDEINENSTINEAINKFESISEACDYWDIFNKHTGEETIDSLIWNDFRNLNQLLKEFQIQFIDRSLLRHLLNELIIRHKRKIAGQFATPQNLARLMVACSISDRNAQTLDPCCGSGTIINEIYKYKTQALNSAESYDTTWGSDKFAFPLLIASINFSDPQAFGTLRRLFKADASELHTGQEISFHDPFTGNITNINLPQFKNIISNLPFVKQEDIRLLNPNIGNINLMISDEIGELKALDGRSDLYGYLPFYFYHLLEPQGKITIITSNSWVGTSWGEQFIKLLKHYYLINSIVISGYGRWFPDAKVVTTVLILDKKDLNENNINQSTKFITLKKKIEDFNSDEIDEISAVINSKSLVNEKDLTIISYSNEKIDSIRNIGLNFNSFFTDNNWLEEISDHLIKVNRVFDISRGERRGWDLFFYPNSENNIEDDYLKPVLITPSSSNRLFANPDSKAFCCTLSKVQLRELNHLGALEWIERFEHQTNKVGLPLQEVLKKANSFWYTFTPRISNEFVASINYGDRLFFSMLNQPTIVNQRLIRFSRINQEVDIHLCHALLNSILGLFYLEAIGFGRGEGVLDLNKNYFKNHYQILNPSMINSYSKQKILDAFTPLCQRPISPLIEELEKDDRNNFDSIILDEFGLLEYFPKIKNSLIDLFSIRNSVLY